MKERDNTMAAKMFKCSIFFAVLIIAALCLMGHVWASEKTYEIRPHIGIGPYSSDNLQLAVIFERLMSQQMSLTKDNIKGNTEMLTLIYKEIQEVNKRLARIEKHLNIPEQSQLKPPIPTSKPKDTKQ